MDINIVGQTTLLYYLLFIVNCVLGVSMMVLNIKYIQRTEEPWKWVMVLGAIVGALWAVFYFSFVVLGIFQHALLLLPIITLTLTYEVSKLIIRLKFLGYYNSFHRSLKLLQKANIATNEVTQKIQKDNPI